MDIYDEMGNLLNRALDRAAPIGRKGRIGFVGPDGTYQTSVEGKPGMVWVRLSENREIVQAVNLQGVAPEPDMPVIVGEVPGSKQLHVLRLDPDASSQLAGLTKGISPWHTHETGALFELVSARRIRPGRVSPYKDPNTGYGLKVWIEPHMHSGGYWPGDDLDLSSYKPAGPNEHRWVLVGIDEATNTAFAEAGPAQPRSIPLSLNDLAVLEHASGTGYCGVALTDTDTTLVDETKFVDRTRWRSEAAGRSGATELDDLTDVDVSGVSDGDALVYDAGTSMWIPGSAGGGAIDLGDLTDVDLTTPPTDEQVLAFDSGTSTWKPATISGGGATKLDDLTDVDLTYPPTEMQLLAYDEQSGVWIPVDFGAFSLNKTLANVRLEKLLGGGVLASANVIDMQSIAQNNTDLVMRITGAANSASATPLKVEINGDTNAAHYTVEIEMAAPGTSGGDITLSKGGMTTNEVGLVISQDMTKPSNIVLTFPKYTDTSQYRLIQFEFDGINGSGERTFYRGQIRWYDDAALNRIRLPNTWAVGTRYELYGVSNGMVLTDVTTY